MGKTAAVVLSWLYKRCHAAAETPRRLVYCLPMRVLVEQTAQNARRWIDNLVAAGLLAAERKPEVHVLMGGEIDLDWDFNPQKDCILVGTQDQLLSRALNRGYAMSRFRWPVHFALLNNDCLWVMDETQLMGVGLKTTAQLQAFREAFATCGAAHSLWMSATLDESALATVDHPRPEGGWPTLALSEKEKGLPQVQKRLQATKKLSKAKTSLGPEDKAYARELAEEVLNKHVPGHLTLVVVNRVGRAQEVYKSLLKAGRTPENTALVHSRFREPDRKKQEELLWGKGDRIAVATQTIEAGVDVSARVLFTEVAPWPSLVQRFGRLNRYGEFPEAWAYWIAIPPEEELAEALRASEPKLSGEKAREKSEQALAKLAPPYELEQLQGSMGILAGLQAADIETLQKVSYSEPAKIQPVIRRKDIMELFDTSPDLSGTDLDVSRYIREQENLDVQVYWRDFEGEPPQQDLPRPARAELLRRPGKRFQRLPGQGEDPSLEVGPPGGCLAASVEESILSRQHPPAAICGWRLRRPPGLDRHPGERGQGPGSGGPGRSCQ